MLLKPVEHYKYYHSGISIRNEIERSKNGVAELGLIRYQPSRKDCDYLILKYRVSIIKHALDRISGDALEVLDIGGRIQPYRAILRNRIKSYISIDPIVTGFVDVIGVGENLPLCDECFDIVFCTQVLSYVDNPAKVLNESCRVLKKNGALILSAPAFFPMHHDERWRFLPDGLSLLFKQFEKVEIFSEGHSAAGFFRTMNVCFRLIAKNSILLRKFEKIVFITSNIVGEYLDHFITSNCLTANYCVIAIK